MRDLWCDARLRIEQSGRGDDEKMTNFEIKMNRKLGRVLISVCGKTYSCDDLYVVSKFEQAIKRYGRHSRTFYHVVQSLFEDYRDQFALTE